MYKNFGGVAFDFLEIRPKLRSSAIRMKLRTPGDVVHFQFPARTSTSYQSSNINLYLYMSKLSLIQLV